MFFLYLTFLYTFHTRLLSLSSKIAWFLTYLFPFLVVCLYFHLDFYFSLLLVFLTYSAYEIGYIFNDCELTKKEHNPTLRLSKDEFFYYEKKKYLILFFRSLSLIILSLVTYIFYPEYFSSTILTVFSILFIYLIYNKIRNFYNLPLYSLLVFLRYFGFFAFFVGDFTLMLVFFMSYPLCVTIEFSSKKRFFTSRYIVIKSFDRFRVVYYFIVLLLSSFIYLINIEYSDLLLYLSLYFFCYRFLSYLFLTKLIRKN